MRNKLFLILIFLLFVLAVQDAFAQSAAAKLPYQNKENFFVSQGYNSPPTHIHKDSYALDFTQNGCEAYGKEVLAAVPGKVILAEESGYNGGYGTQLLILDDDNGVTRYAHLIAGSVPIKAGDTVVRGAILGKLGNTGLVAGASCAEHPGTHLHFAMYDKNADGSFSARNAEPISGYANIIEGKWYVSDNMPPSAEDLLGDIAAIMAKILGDFGGGAGTSSAQPVLGVVSSPSSSIIITTRIQSSSSIKTIVSDLDFNGTATDTNLSAAPAQSVFSQTEDSGSDTAITTNASSGVPSIGTSLLPESSSSAALPPQENKNIPIPAGGVSVTIPIFTPTTLPQENSSTQIFVTPSSTVVESSSTPITDGSGAAASSSVSDPGDDNGEASSTTTSSSPPFSLAAPMPVASTGAITSFNSSTLAIDFSWTAPRDASGSSDGMTYKIFNLDASDTAPLWAGTSTEFSYPVSDGGDYHFSVQAADSAGDTSLAITTVNVPDWFAIVQPSDYNDSHESWYDDNWYDLGTGFYGTIRSLTLEGYINDTSFGKSHLSLGEFLDPEYTKLNQQFAISDDAPFTSTNAKITTSDLHIPLQPNKYYRLYTDQDWQNRSVILKGTNATGTAMWDTFIYGEGGVQNKYSFYPYLSWAFVPNFPPLATPNPPASVTINFSPLLSLLDFSWPSATDQDISQSLLTYQTNCGTSPTPDPANWQSAGNALFASCVIDPMKNYYIGIRAADDLGNISAPLIQEWISPLTIPIAS